MNTQRKGFTLIELLITMAVLISVAGGIFAVQRDFLSANRYLEDTLLAQREAQAVITGIVYEIRTAQQSGAGAYPIEKAEPDSFAFYANIDGDSARERVQYFKIGNVLRKSVVQPTGDPLTYATTSAPEMVSAVLYDMIASTTAPLFRYYDKEYAGTTSPLAAPVDVSKIRIVEITLITDRTPSLPPPPVVTSSKVEIRNLKDNL